MTSELVSIEIPTDDRELSVVLLELDAPWHSVNQIETVLASLERIDLDTFFGRRALLGFGFAARPDAGDRCAGSPQHRDLYATSV
jgi:hypothetical protein